MTPLFWSSVVFFCRVSLCVFKTACHCVSLVTCQCIPLKIAMSGLLSTCETGEFLHNNTISERKEKHCTYSFWLSRSVAYACQRVSTSTKTNKKRPEGCMLFVCVALVVRVSCECPKSQDCARGGRRNFRAISRHLLHNAPRANLQLLSSLFYLTVIQILKRKSCFYLMADSTKSADTNASAAAPSATGAPTNFDYTKHIVGTGTAEDPYTFTDPFTGNTYYFDNAQQQWILMVSLFLAFETSVYR